MSEVIPPQSTAMPSLIGSPSPSLEAVRTGEVKPPDESDLEENASSKVSLRKEKAGRAKVRTYSATDRDMDMLAAIAEYHGFSRSGMLASLIRKEFWRCFPSGTVRIRPDVGARVEDVMGGRLAAVPVGVTAQDTVQGRVSVGVQDRDEAL